MHFDGACQPPHARGIATWAFTIEGAGLEHEASGLAAPPYSPESTNNVAEYSGAIHALEHLLEKGYQGPVVVYGDSELVVRQMSGEYRVKAPHLQAYHDRLGALARRFSSCRFVAIPREENGRADELTKRAVYLARRESDRGGA